ncbi:MAG: hypothetical protein WC635_11790 [Bacteriovorax sp.]|jgi:response regulator RpfG family c-di-GMP phosphodiesterase
MNNNTDNLMPIKIELAIKYCSFFTFSFYVKKPNDEFVEISHKPAGLKSIFRGYKERGLDIIYLRPTHYEEIISKLKNVLSHANNFKIVFNDLDDLFASVQMQIKRHGFSDYSLNQCKEITTIVVQNLMTIPNLADLISETKINNSNIFYQSMVKAFISICMLETFDWQSDILKNKIAQACLLMDLNLTNDDLVIMHKEPRNMWPQYIFNHPHLNAKTVKDASDQVSIQVLQIIELHHELPNAAGYPRGVDSSNIPLLAALVIVAEEYTSRVLRDDYSPEQSEQMMHTLCELFSKGIFLTARESLFAAINKK